MKRRMIFCLLLSFVLAGCEAEKSTDAPDKPVGGMIKADPARGQQLAEACVSCHGMDGMASARGVPYIGGQQPDYLISAMKAYLEGRRKHEEMRLAIADLDEQAMADLASHYARQPVAWRGAGMGLPSQASRKKPVDRKAIAAGKAKSQSCAGCHGLNGISARAEFPSLAGLPEDYFRNAMDGYFKTGRINPYMDMFKTALSSSDINDLAAYYASLAPKRLAFNATGNVAAGKSKAAACAGCHGPDGNSLSEDFPNLTGQSFDYLVKAIEDYRSGRRRHHIMKNATAGLGKQDVRNLAAYFSRQDAVKIGTRTNTASGDPLVDGARLAAACDGCHGSAGNSRASGTPSLAGMSAHYLNKAIKAYRDGARNHALMRNMVGNLGDLDVEKLSFHYAMQEPVLVKKSFKGDEANGARLAESCDTCHGKQGNSTDIKTPRLAAQDTAYLVNALAEYAKGARGKENVMNAQAGKLSKEFMRDIALHYSNQTPVSIETRAPETSVMIASRCDRCHGENGKGGSQGQPRLAGQAEGYLFKVLQQYQREERKHSSMKIMTELLNLIETHEIAKHYAKQKP